MMTTWTSSFTELLWTLGSEGFHLCLFYFLTLFHLISWQTEVPCATIAGFCCPLVVTVRPVAKDKLEQLVHACCSVGGEHMDNRFTLVTQVSVHSRSWFWQLHVDFCLRRRELAVFLSSPDVSSSFPAVLGVKALDKTQIPAVAPGLGLQVPFRFEGDALGRIASLIHWSLWTSSEPGVGEAGGGGCQQSYLPWNLKS